MRAQRRTLAPGARQAAQPTARSRVAHERSNATLPTNSGARAAPHARAGRAPSSSAARWLCSLSASPLGARAAPHARAGRAPSSSAACPEPPRAISLGRPDRDQPMRWRTYESRPNGRVLSKGFSSIGPAPPSAPGQTRVSHRAPQAPRVLSLAAPRVEPLAQLPSTISTAWLAEVSASSAFLPTKIVYAPLSISHLPV